MLSRPAEPIRTARLVLRPFGLGDVDDVWSFQREPSVARFMRWEPRDREQSASSVREMVTENGLTAEGDCLSLAIVEPPSTTVIGQAELVWLSEPDSQGEIGFVLHPAHQGRGLATEAAAALLRVGFGDLGLHRIAGRCNATNTASAAVLQRLGMRREAHLRDTSFRKGAWQSELVFALLRDEYAG
ncbi:GNAT family N-acetyltransferase [Actinoplanes sp. N902-109]|uniref:GNAT family N-acetyltransferase n=1 Tax=Actinoplanes sp. (strain N902-109) TaxID=649831 RepID=UPI0003294843|nr:GNAT family protein [Actinoplanes sp. N902-109]AGL18009.1 acetyltransferase [Actinoplanes sp. N902-109]